MRHRCSTQSNSSRETAQPAQNDRCTDEERLGSGRKINNGSKVILGSSASIKLVMLHEMLKGGASSKNGIRYKWRRRRSLLRRCEGRRSRSALPQHVWNAYLAPFPCSEASGAEELRLRNAAGRGRESVAAVFCSFAISLFTIPCR